MISRILINQLKWSSILQANNLLILPLFSIILARFYTPLEFAQYVITQSSVLVLSIVIISVLPKNIAFYQIRNVIDLQVYDKMALLFAILATVVYFGIHYWLHVSNVNFSMGICMILAPIYVLRALKAIPNGIIDRDGDFKTRAQINIFSSAVSMLIAIALLMGSVSGIFVLASNVLIFEMVSAYLYRKTSDLSLVPFSGHEDRREVVSSIRSTLKRDWKYLLFNIKNQGIYQISNTMDKFLLTTFRTESQSGAYVKFMRVAMMVPTSVAGIVNRVNFSRLVQLKSDTKEETSLYLLSIIALFFGTMILTNFAEEIISVALGDQWLTSVQFLKFSCPIAFLFGVNAFMNNHFVAKANTKLVINRAFFVNALRLIGLAVIFVVGARTEYIFALLFAVQLLNYIILARYWNTYAVHLLSLLLVSILVWFVFR